MKREVEIKDRKNEQDKICTLKRLMYLFGIQ